MGTEVIYCYSWNYEPTHSSHKTLLYALQGNKCRHCQLEFLKEVLTIDHIIARTDGGKNEFLNKQLLCIDCHVRKTDLETKERHRKWREKRQPTREYIPVNNQILAGRRLL